MSRRPVLVAGATGLLGREIVALLAARGVRLVTASRHPAPAPDHQVADLSDPRSAAALLERCAPQAVVLLAGGPGGDLAELHQSYVLPTVNLLQATPAAELAPYFVVFGSAAEYGEGAGGRLAEDAPTAPISDYGRAKLAQTALAGALARRRGIPLTVLRPFNVVSPNLAPATALGHWRRELLAARSGPATLRCGRLDLVRDFVPAAAIAETVARLLLDPQPGATLNVCSGTGIVVRSVLEEMARQAGRELRVVEDPALAAIPAARSAVGDPALLTRKLGLRFPIDAVEVARQMLAPGEG